MRVQGVVQSGQKPEREVPTGVGEAGMAPGGQGMAVGHRSSPGPEL